MLAPSHRWRAYACCAAASLGLAGFSTVPASAAAAGAAAGHLPARTAAAGPADRSNVGATHSPELLKQLAGRAGAPGGTRSGPASRMAVKGDEQGVDVASYQHPNGAAINWPKAHAAGIDFAGVKATEGDYYRNPYALTDLAKARAAGLAVAAYSFAIPNGNGASSNPVTQAKYLLSYLGSYSSTVPVMLDIEYNPYGRECYGLSAKAMVSWVSSFNAEIKAKTGRRPVIYAPPSWWVTCTGSSAAFAKDRLWVPDYTTASRPEVTPGWKTWSLWQYTSTGTVPGIQDPGHTDLDQANPADQPVLGPAAARQASA